MSDRSVDTVYYEEVRAHPIMQFVLYGVIALLAYLTTVVEEIPSVFAVLMMGILFMIASVFGRLRIVIDDRRLTVGFSFIRHSISLDNIEYAETRRYPWWYGGFGIRFGFDMSVAYAQNFGGGVWVVPKRGRKLFFSSYTPEVVVEKLNSMTR